jgi:hypothetical protein
MTDGLFEREDDVRTWMQELAAVPINLGPLPDARQLWWKAEMLKRWDAQRQAAGPIERAEPVQVSVGLAGAVALIASLWRYAPVPSNTLVFATILSLTLVVAVAALTLRQS